MHVLVRILGTQISRPKRLPAVLSVREEAIENETNLELHRLIAVKLRHLLPLGEAPNAQRVSLPRQQNHRKP